MRMFDSYDGTMYGEFPANHCPGEGVTAVLVDTRNTCMVTADGAGFL